MIRYHILLIRRIMFTRVIMEVTKGKKFVDQKLLM